MLLINFHHVGFYVIQTSISLFWFFTYLVQKMLNNRNSHFTKITSNERKQKFFESKLINCYKHCFELTLIPYNTRKLIDFDYWVQLRNSFQSQFIVVHISLKGSSHFSKKRPYSFSFWWSCNSIISKPAHFWI